MDLNDDADIYRRRAGVRNRTRAAPGRNRTARHEVQRDPRISGNLAAL